MAVGLYVLVFFKGGGDCSGSLLVQVLQKSPAYFLCEDHGLHYCGQVFKLLGAHWTADLFGLLDDFALWTQGLIENVADL